MEENTPLNGNPTPSNEIDLLSLFVACCKAIGHGVAVIVKGIGIALTACFNFCLRHFFWLLGGIVTGCLAVIISSLIPRQNYVTGEAMLTCFGTSLTDIKNEVIKLDQMIRFEKNATSVQSKLGLSPELARGLKGIQFGFGMDLDNDTVADYVEYISDKAKNIYTEKTLKGGAGGDRIIQIPIQQKVPHIFYLKIETNVNDIQDFHTIGDAIYNYLNHLPALQMTLELQRQSWEARIEEIDRQKMLLDSMLRIEYFENSRLKAASYGQGAERLVLADQKQLGIPFDYKDIIALTDQKTALLTLLAQTQQMVNVVSDFQPISAVTQTKKTSFGLIWICLFIVAAVIYDYRKPIGQYIKAQRQR